LNSTCRAGARLAEPGEFTLRAFLAGRLDLTQAEAVLGVIDARDHDDLSTALTQLAGGLARPLHKLRDDLVQLLAELEAGLDFTEEDIEFISKDALLARLNCAQRLLCEVAQQMSSRGTAATATLVALVGPPNAGKSSLFNALVSRFGQPGGSADNTPMSSIVSSRCGTTRDYVTASIEIDGARCELVDTAGIENDSNAVPCGDHPGEEIQSIDVAAQSLTKERRAAAAIRIHCIDSTNVAAIASDALRKGSDAIHGDIVVLTKIDLMDAPLRVATGPNHSSVIATSSRTGAGLDELCRQIRAALGTEAASQKGHAVAATAERCRESIRLAVSAIARATDVIQHETGDELAAAELHVALSELGKVVGAVYTDDLLDRIFSTFCIGK
jgi:tRNA modification GTPase